MKKQVSTAQTESNIQEVMRLLSETPQHITRLSKGLSDQKLNEAFGSDERSFHESLAHMINAEALNSEAIYLALMLNEPVLHDLHAERDLGKLLRFNLLPFAELVSYYKTRRSVLLRVLESLTDEQWSRCIRENGKARKESVYWRARALALHELEHLQDIESKLKK